MENICIFTGATGNNVGMCSCQKKTRLPRFLLDSSIRSIKEEITIEHGWRTKSLLGKVPVLWWRIRVPSETCWHQQVNIPVNGAWALRSGLLQTPSWRWWRASAWLGKKNCPSNKLRVWNLGQCCDYYVLNINIILTQCHLGLKSNPRHWCMEIDGSSLERIKCIFFEMYFQIKKRGVRCYSVSETAVK